MLNTVVSGSFHSASIVYLAHMCQTWVVSSFITDNSTFLWQNVKWCQISEYLLTCIKIINRDIESKGNLTCRFKENVLLLNDGNYYFVFDEKLKFSSMWWVVNLILIGWVFSFLGETWRISVSPFLREPFFIHPLPPPPSFNRNLSIRPPRNKRRA